MSSKKKFKFKKSKADLYVGIIMLILAICTLCGLISEFGEEGIGGAIIIIVLATIIGGALVLGGCVSIAVHFLGRKALKEALERHGEEYLIDHIEQNTIHVYKGRFSSKRIYFTERFVIDAKEFVLTYEDISMMHYITVWSKYGSKPMIKVLLRNGKNFTLGNGLKPEELGEIMSLCRQMCSEILMDATKENRERHKKRVLEYKKSNMEL